MLRTHCDMQIKYSCPYFQLLHLHWLQVRIVVQFSFKECNRTLQFCVWVLNQVDSLVLGSFGTHCIICSLLYDDRTISPSLFERVKSSIILIFVKKSLVGRLQMVLNLHQVLQDPWVHIVNCHLTLSDLLNLGVFAACYCNWMPCFTIKQLFMILYKQTSTSTAEL